MTYEQEIQRIANGFYAPSLRPPMWYGDMTKTVFVHLIRSSNNVNTQYQLENLSKAYLDTPGFYKCLRDLFICIELGHIPYDIEKSPFRSTIRNVVTNDNSGPFWMIQTGVRFVNDILDKVIQQDTDLNIIAINPIEDKNVPHFCDTDIFCEEESESDSGEDMEKDSQMETSDSVSQLSLNTITRANKRTKQCPHCDYSTSSSGGHMKRHIRNRH